MRTLQEKYQAIQEGNYSKGQFIAEARTQLPHIITQFNGYEDTVQILKNKGILTEAMRDSLKSFKGLKYEIWYQAPKGYYVKGVGELNKAIGHGFFDTSKEAEEHAEMEINGYLDDYGDDLGEGTGKVKRQLVSESRLTNKSLPDYRFKPTNELDKYPYEQILKNKGILTEALTDYSRVLELPNGKYFAIDDSWEDQYKGKSGLFFTVKGNTVYDKDGIAFEVSPREFISQFTPEEILKVENVNENRLTNKSLPDYRFKPTNELDKYPYEQILRGLRVELEGMGICGVPNTDEYKQALAKVLKNLHKDEIFYTNQLAGETKNTDKKDSLVPVKVKKQEVTNSVDTFNGLKKATLKEGFKKIITKILTEGEDPLRDYHQTRETENKPINEVSQNDPKIEKLVNGINTLISQAVDQDGDKIGVIWPGGTWDEPYTYEPLVYRNGQLTVTCQSAYGGKPETETILKRNMELDGLPLLRTLLRLYKKATKQVNESGEHDIMMRLLDTGIESREEIQNYIKKTYPTYPEQQVTFLTNLFFDKYQ